MQKWSLPCGAWSDICFSSMFDSKSLPSPDLNEERAKDAIRRILYSSIIFSDKEHDWTEGSEQWKWLNEELSKVNRSITPWVIVTSHRPMIVSAYGSSENPVEEQLRLAMLPLFKKHKVDLFVGGHWHHYERSDPIDGTVHVIAGSAGAKDETVYPYRDLPTVPVKWPWVRGYLELQVSRENMTGIFWGINDSMADRDLIEFDTFVVPSRLG
ncbi:hypothetical protein FOL47_001628 [Perkinsus chesapeaki]|uniref:Calcineurin-like phosphoesterase domain-containing protein n=1 Tax=Perkinsus chesapeaki TaxID=330153 RepID=A0A7J6N114_PERCH|nr:hypothetical protein FOL47_001628 [Perkinsus chesapeaki]